MSPRAPGRRSWTWARGVPLLVGLATIAALAGTVAWTTSQPRSVQMLALAGVLALGALCFIGGRARLGAPAIRRRVAEQRRQWAAARQWSFAGDEPAADSATADLVLPRGWNPPLPLASVRGTFHGRRALVQTWELRSVATSKRQTTYREVVLLDADTRGHRCAVVSAAQIDPGLLKPAWVNLTRRPQDSGERLHADGDPLILDSWGPTIKQAMAAHEDLPFIVAAGAGHVVVVALDDPRTSTTEARLELALTVADTIDPAGRAH